MKIGRRTFLVGGTAISAVILGELRKPDRGLAQSRGINLYSARHYDTDEQLFDSFQRNTGFQVNLIEAKAEELIERIKSEATNSPADVLITVDAGNLSLADRGGILEPVNSELLKSRIPANLRHPEGHWFGFSRRARVIYYNKAKVNPSQLSTYEDLADSKWRGKILIRSSSNIYNLSLLASLIAAHGADRVEEWSKGLVANFARPPEGNDTAQIKACAAGMGDIAIANTYYFARLIKSEDPADKEVVEKVGLFFPNQGSSDRGTHVNISGAAVLKTAPNKQAAIRFLEHLANAESQRYFAEGNNEYPAVEGVDLDPVLASFGTFKTDPVNVAKYGEFQDDAIRIADRAGWK
jgi:iron(III) transport system substrate-binding protein